MIQESCRVLEARHIGGDVHLLAFSSPRIAAEVRAGQFVNLKVSEGSDPLLRRPFSVSYAEGDRVEVVYQVVGAGTGALRSKQYGDAVDVLGPLGTPYRVDDTFETAVLVAGGLGVAPMPLLGKALEEAGRRVQVVLGARTRAALVTRRLGTVSVATDDGSQGVKGTVIDLLQPLLASKEAPRPKLFGCGPMPMLHALAEFARAHGLPCEVSLEGAMACGFGICQGCPVELTDGPQRYALMCKDGPVFDIQRIKI